MLYCYYCSAELILVNNKYYYCPWCGKIRGKKNERNII